MKIAISIILLLISFLTYIVYIFDIDITSFIKNKKRKKVKREIDQTIQEVEEAQQVFNKIKEGRYIMTKLEEKILELGYFKDKNYSFIYKKIEFSNILKIYTECEDKNILCGGSIEPLYDFHNQYDIDYLQQAFNILQHDLEVLRQCQNVEAANI